jgi:hypothetical protein
MILLGGVHHALQCVDPAEPHDDLVAAQLFKSFRNLIADEQITGCLLLL